MKDDAKNPTHPATTSRRSADPAMQQQIAERAYQLFEMRGGAHGNDVEDWVRAEREVRARWGRKQTTTRSNRAPNTRSRTGTRKAA